MSVCGVRKGAKSIAENEHFLLHSVAHRLLKKVPLAGFEPAISGFEVRRVIRYATGVLETTPRLPDEFRSGMLIAEICIQMRIAIVCGLGEGTKRAHFGHRFLLHSLLHRRTISASLYEIVLLCSGESRKK